MMYIANYRAPHYAILSMLLLSLSDAELRNLNSSQSIVRMIKSRSLMGEECSMHGEVRNACSILVGNL
jgi:hypothetical protein